MQEVHWSPFRAYPLKQLKQLVGVPLQVLQVESHLIMTPLLRAYPDITTVQIRRLLSPSLHVWHPASQVKTLPLESTAQLEPSPLRIHLPP